MAPFSHPSSSAKGGWLPGAFGLMALVGFALGGTIDGRGGFVPRPAGVPTVGGYSFGSLAAIGHCRAAQTIGPSQAQALQVAHGRTIGRGPFQPAVQASTALDSTVDPSYNDVDTGALKADDRGDDCPFDPCARVR